MALLIPNNFENASDLFIKHVVREDAGCVELLQHTVLLLIDHTMLNIINTERIKHAQKSLIDWPSPIDYTSLATNDANTQKKKIILQHLVYLTRITLNISICSMIMMSVGVPTS